MYEKPLIWANAYAIITPHNRNSNIFRLYSMYIYFRQKVKSYNIFRKEICFTILSVLNFQYVCVVVVLIMQYRLLYASFSIICM